MRLTIGLLGSTLVVAPAMADEIAVSVEIPRLKVAEYHRPYVAAWVEDSSGKAVANLAVWYDTDMRGGEGKKWLSDMRTWWRETGRSLKMPADGISGPTRAPGRHTIRIGGGSSQIRALRNGSYTLKVEAAREVGGREVLSIPFSWPAGGGLTKSVKGKSELGTVALSIK